MAPRGCSGSLNVGLTSKAAGPIRRAIRSAPTEARPTRYRARGAPSSSSARAIASLAARDAGSGYAFRSLSRTLRTPRMRAERAQISGQIEHRSRARFRARSARRAAAAAVTCVGDHHRAGIDPPDSARRATTPSKATRTPEAARRTSASPARRSVAREGRAPCPERKNRLVDPHAEQSRGHRIACPPLGLGVIRRSREPERTAGAQALPPRKVAPRQRKSQRGNTPGHS